LEHAIYIIYISESLIFGDYLILNYVSRDSKFRFHNNQSKFGQLLPATPSKFEPASP